ncbi:MAG: glycosyl transferase group 1 [Conexibacter sp.]|nr:glycosyl transferase group 1 [Conexibacter sp.]
MKVASSSSQEAAPASAELRSLEISSAAGMSWPPWDELRELIDADEMSDVLALHEALGTTVLDGRYVAGLIGPWGRLLQRLPFRVAQAMELLRRRRDYDVIFAWGEINTLIVAALMMVVPRRPPHICVLFWPAKAKKALPLLALQRTIDRMIIPSPLQRRRAIRTFRFPRRKVVDIPWDVDTGFWRPMPDIAEDDLICSVGLEMRDYPTLLAALGPLDVRCHIAAAAANVALVPDSAVDDGPLPPRVTVGRRTQVELRELYARSRFVVVPLLPSTSDNGITTCLEAMAMGKAVICTETEGQIGVLEDGVNSLRVPPEDPVALRTAIERLWNDRELCARLGAAGRRTAEGGHATSAVVQRFVAVVDEALAERRGAGDRERRRVGGRAPIARRRVRVGRGR